MLGTVLSRFTQGALPKPMESSLGQRQSDEPQPGAHSPVHRHNREDLELPRKIVFWFLLENGL